jgi:paraquat-inducible protein A
MSGGARAAEVGLICCRVCALVCDAGGGLEARCPRCDAEIRSRKPNSISRTWAMLTAAVIFYIPANVLPVMHTQSLGDSHGGTDNTIMSGVIEFWQNGSWGIASIIFIASILIPSTKIIALVALLVHAQRRTGARSVQPIRWYRMLELVGYWSMLDVLVVGLVTAIVTFRGLSDAEPRIGILYFGVVVILTMLATLSFDPRLLWDRRAGQN